MKRNYTCIICPNGCEITVETDAQQIVSMTGAGCPRGKRYVKQEIIAPLRTISSSVRVLDGVMPIASVRLTRPVPRDQIFPVMREIEKAVITAPVAIGDCVIPSVLGFDSNVIITKNIDHI